jgi:hypothetical protein
MSRSKLERAMEEFRAYRRTLSPVSQSIFNAGLIGRLLVHIPEEEAVKSIHQSIQAWENHHLVTPVTQEEVYAQMH